MRLLPPEQSIRRELVLIKVRAESREVRNEVIQIANIFRASIIDVSIKSLTIALIGDESKAAAMEDLLESFGILELVRTGMVALERGEATIRNRTRVSFGIYLFSNVTQSAASYALALASFKFLPFAVMPKTLPPFVTIPSSVFFVPAWKQ